MKAVKIVRDPKTIKILADIVRREILRLLSVQSLTETQLAERLSLTKPSTAHHLTVLRKAGLISIKRTEIGSHGILEKYYEPSAKLFIEDWQAIPLELKRYFLHGHIERLRGMISVFQLVAEMRGKMIEITSEQLKELAYEVARVTPLIGKKYENSEKIEDREMLLIKIYSETLKTVMGDPKWRRFFAGLEDIALAKTAT